MISLSEELAAVELGEPAHFRNLTLFPLFRRSVKTTVPNYLVLEDAIAAGIARVTEINPSGYVPELRFVNTGDAPVLLLDGEELVGAKQNRTLNLTVLAPAKSSTVIPVSCVESGRWHSTSPEFQPSPQVMYARARGERVSQVSASMRQSGARRSDQEAVWAAIREKADCLAAPSPTSAMGDIFARHQLSLEDFTRAFHWSEHQAGAVFAIDGRPVGLDIFDHPVTMRRLFPKLLRSYALDALDTRAADVPKPPREVVAALLRAVTEAPASAHPAIGLGKDVRITGHGVTGAALYEGDRYVHICGFVSNGERPTPGITTRVARPSRRRM
jgi:hypothetical protein